MVADAVVVRPELLAGLGVKRIEPSVGARHEHQAALGPKQACQGRILVFDFPGRLAADGVAGRDVTERLITTGRRDEGEAGPEVQLRRGGRLHLLKVYVGAELHADLVIEIQVGVVAARIPADRAVDGRANGFVHPNIKVTAADQFAGLGIDSFDEVRCLAEVPDVFNLQRRVAHVTIVDIDVAAFVWMHNVVLPVALDHDELAHGAVEIPGVVGNFLEKGLELAGVRVDCHDARGVKVLTRPRALGLPVRPAPVVVGRGVRRAPIHGVGHRVIAADHPTAAAAVLPAVVAPTRARAFIAPDRVELPEDLAATRVDPVDGAAAARILAACGADDELVLDDQRGAREALVAFVGTDDLCVPDLLAGLGVNSDDPAIDRADVNLAVGRRNPAVVGVIDRALGAFIVELRLELP